jgi:tRNA A64-2'-O-ribosylphosphate transferase
MPDALSKTVPIWCAVINIALQLRREDEGGKVDGWDTTLYLPPNIVSPSEQAQIQALLPSWAAALEVCLGQAGGLD